MDKELNEIIERAAALVQQRSRDVDTVDFSDLSQRINRPGNLQVDCQCEKISQKSEIEVLPEYEFLLQSLAAGDKAIFVTGKAGTGKSTMVHYLREQLPRSAVVAPTAIAAMNVGGSTIHSFFSIPPRAVNADEAFKPRKNMRPVIENLDLLIIDEISMVGPNLVDCMSNSLKNVRENDEPFGGVPVLFVGDILQLPPVVADRDVGLFYTHRYDSPYFYSAEVFRDCPIRPLQLTRVFRQKDRGFIEALDCIRCNRDHRQAVALINRRCYRDCTRNLDHAIHLVPTHAAAASINNVRLEKIHEPAEFYDAEIHGKKELWQKRMPAAERLELKKGAQVIFLKNNPPMWLNGTLGVVEAMCADHIEVKLLETGNIVAVARTSWKKVSYRYDKVKQRISSKSIGSFRQFPLGLGWAITIHKSQGMTMDEVCIDLGRGAFCCGQTYVALSRCRSLEGIRLAKPISMGDVRADPTVLAFYQHLGFLQGDAG